jgi:hypothetical protein
MTQSSTCRGSLVADVSMPRSEMNPLVEACTRVGSRLLTHLRELLGCRQGLEQLIFSSVQQEINDRYALGWTGRGLSVAASLGWFGQRYHWTTNREIQDIVITANLTPRKCLGHSDRNGC